MTVSRSGRVAVGLDIDVDNELTVEYLVHEYHRDLYGYAFRLCGNVADAEDLTQQTYLQASRKLNQLREASKARSWLFTVMRNLFLKSCRKRTEVPAANLEMSVDEIPETAAADDAIDCETLQQTIAALPEEFRLVLCMFYFEERSYKEIADCLSMPIGTVMSRLARAKGRLRKQLLEQSETKHSI